MNLRSSIANSTCVAAVMWCLVLGCDTDVEPRDEAPEPDEVTEATTNSEVAAVVNDREITTVEVERHLDRLGELYHHSERSFDPSTRRMKRNKVIQRLIDRELLRDYASHQDVQLDPEDVDRQLHERIDRAFDSTDAFRRYLDKGDMTVSDYRDRIHDEMALERLVERRIDDEAIGEERLRDYYDRIANRRPADDRIEASRLRIELHGGSQQEYRSLLQHVRRAVDELDNATGLNGLGDNLEQWTHRLEADARITHHEPRWQEQKRLDPRASKKLFKKGDSPRNEADTVRIVETAMGVDVYWIHDRREAGIRQFDEVEDLVRDRARRSQLQQQRRRLIDELRESADISIYDEAAELATSQD